MAGFERKVIMSILQKILLQEAEVGIKAMVAVFGAKYFGPKELAAFNTVLDALADLPNRIGKGGAK